MKAAASYIFDDLKVQIGFLFCADDLIPYYAGIGWQALRSKVIIHQPTGKKEWPSNKMILDPNNNFEEPKEVDLNGLPW